MKNNHFVHICRSGLRMSAYIIFAILTLGFYGMAWGEAPKPVSTGEVPKAAVTVETPKSADTGEAPRPVVTGDEFVLVKGGCYQMGDTFGDGNTEEIPSHKVCVSDFYIGKYAVTQGQWKAVMGSNPSEFRECGDDCPVERVSWNDAMAFIQKLNMMKPGNNYRLPTEAEWEYAARDCGKKEKYAGGVPNPDSAAWYFDNSDMKTHPVGTKAPNILGLYDMSGNVFQWCSDRDDKNYYSASPIDNPQGPASGDYRVIRGGSWLSLQHGMRASYRLGRLPERRSSDIGLRLVKDAGKSIN